MTVVPDPAQVESPHDLAIALDILRKSKDLSLRQLEDRAKQMPDAAGRVRSLPRSTLSDALRTGQMSKETLVTLLLTCGVPAAEHEAWLSAWERARTSDVRRPSSAVRVRHANARLLGVHSSIAAPGETGLPLYVDRDVERGDDGIHEWLRQSAQHGGFLLLVGGSCVGKTRTAYEAALKVLPDWWLFHPRDASEIRALTEASPTRLVLWLDELQRYFGSDGLDAGTVRAVLGHHRSVVIISSIWPGRFGTYTALPKDGQDPFTEEREIINLSHTIRLKPDFSRSERRRAIAAADRDRRLRVALRAELGVTQTLAAGQQLLGRWEDAAVDNPYAWAVVTAALDAVRIGVPPPLTPEFLQKAAIGYCNPRHRAEASDDWFDQAIAHATTQVDGTASLLTASSSQMARRAGYEPADFLVDRATRSRRTALVPGSVWKAVIDTCNAYVCGLVGDGAYARLFYTHAEQLYRRSLSEEPPGAVGADALVGILARQRRVAEIEDLARQGHPEALDEMLRIYLSAGEFGKAWGLVEVWERLPGSFGADLATTEILDELVARDRDDELRAVADLDLESSWPMRMGTIRKARKALAGLLARQEKVDELGERAESGDLHALRHLADFGCEDTVVEVLNSVVHSDGTSYDVSIAQEYLSELLERRGETELSVWDVHLETEPSEIARFEQNGLLDALRSRADQGDVYVGRKIAAYLVEQGRLNELRELADGPVGFLYATAPLADALAEQGLHAELRARAEGGDHDAIARLIEALADQGQTSELRQWALRGNTSAFMRLSDLGLTAEALAIMRSRAQEGSAPDPGLIATLLTRAEQLEELDVLAKRGNRTAQEGMADILGAREDRDQLRMRALAGEQPSRDRLVELLVERGETEEAIELVEMTKGEWDAVTDYYLELLASHNQSDQLLLEVFGGTPGAGSAYVNYWKKQRRLERAHHIEVYGLDPDDYLDA
ncbi:hypothetical protein [Streptomyces sp. 3213.3]|uniref:hypothetical protein n=1 Tax=Streptomyces sp. 3213.3 TaxID=1855348 RepID=UPI00135AC5A9|nr:hypothetical protein [Streptomyces sp. 3213.3]